jgi:hypothetical protein
MSRSNKSGGIPDNVVLVSSCDKLSRPCHAVWRSEMLVGVAFRAAEAQRMPRM